MNHNNSVTINECITNLMTIEDSTNEIDSLEYLIETINLAVDDKTKFKKVLTKLLIKNTKQADKINKVANKLNRLGMY